MKKLSKCVGKLHAWFEAGDDGSSYIASSGLLDRYDHSAIFVNLFSSLTASSYYYIILLTMKQSCPAFSVAPIRMKIEEIFR